MAKIRWRHFTRLGQAEFVSLYRVLSNLNKLAILMLSFVVKSLTMRYAKDLLIFTNSTFGQDTYYMVCYYYFNETEYKQLHSYKVNSMQTIISDNNVKLKLNQGIYFVLVNGLNVKETHKLSEAVEVFTSYAPEKTYKAVNIESIKAGDTVQHNGELRTVCANDIKYNAFTGTTIFGDSYRLGYLKVIKVIFN